MLHDMKRGPASRMTPLGPQHFLNHLLADLMNKEISSPDELSSYADRFLDLFSGQGFKHNPSEVFRSITAAQKAPPERPGGEGADVVDPARLDCLMNNLVMIRGRCSHEARADAAERFDAFFDDIAVECARLNYEAQHAKALTDRIERSAALLRLAVGEASHLKRRLERSQKEYIAILGIFAAVVVAFSAGVNFSITSISASQEYNVVRAAFVVSVVGAFMFNSLYALFTFIYRMIRQNGDNWGILDKPAFLKINRAIILTISALFVLSILISVGDRFFLS